MAVSPPLSPISTTIKRPLTTTEVVDAVIPIDIRLEGNPGNIRKPKPSSVPSLAFGEVMAHPL
ncbi:hypothetical protein I314_00853 [Cryptococcus bacillisporus CA1873]|uniref:Uncharacterized protein n=1 Tax=Cryptococcus bacillisporus CA1873 TaxID=1296111 RepID=A0ABR5BGW9_CRYGA|nr:hypothetical protein I314_00853 [Cryptococcus bacillisporus CA1873]|eukprot:KIR68434.1 hypothetical protein I314_00853 [Cryptococcus gattii CA1873]